MNYSQPTGCGRLELTPSAYLCVSTHYPSLIRPLSHEKYYK
jgi:hypothetical protein